jgi:DNA-binding transcriptional regulator YhcF (GntR family)
MNVALDHESPVPLYHQLAEALRYRIATGEIAADAVLPPLRRAAERWGLNLHTVRQAYAELARIGVVVTRTPGGTRVLQGRRVEKAQPGTKIDVEQFVRGVTLEARLRHGLEVDDLIALLCGARAAEPRPAIAVVECSMSQCQDLAFQLEERWQVRATPWVLGDAPPPPGALVIATYFHYNDIRRAWPERLPQVRFLPIAPEADLADKLASGRGRRGKVTVTLCERDDAMARNIAADLVRILPSGSFRVVIRVVARAEEALRGAAPGSPILFSPRMWGELSEDARRDPRALQVRYVFEPDAASALATEKGWSRT